MALNDVVTELQEALGGPDLPVLCAKNRELRGAPPHPSIDDTIAYATALHEGQRDKAGAPYIAHPLSVMRRVPEEMWHVAVLHDVKEDCGVTDEDLRDEGYSEEEIAAIDLLTKPQNLPYRAFIDRIAMSNNLVAITVKLADLEDNLDPSRGYKHSPQQLSRYIDARTRLQMVKEGR